MTFHPMRAELFHADGRTDMTKLIVAFQNFANKSTNRSRCQGWTRAFYQHFDSHSFVVCHPRFVSNKSNYKVYVYIVKHN